MSGKNKIKTSYAKEINPKGTNGGCRAKFGRELSAGIEANVRRGTKNGSKAKNVNGENVRYGIKHGCKVNIAAETAADRRTKAGYGKNIACGTAGEHGIKVGNEAKTVRELKPEFGGNKELYEAIRETLPPVTINTKLPELLVPCGSEDAVRAAAENGADAVYCGGKMLNARMNAKNFDDEALKRAVTYCQSAGVKVYVTLNTLVYDRELRAAAEYAKMLYELGVDALIVADAGFCMLLREYLPGFELHASTQLSAHNLSAAETLAALGFRRLVLAREMGLADIRYLCENSPIETELFVHGALCVSRSGQCLMSSVVGGRSGNRGECAQPCRLPYNGGYPLSLKDLCLAGHITDLISCGVSSLKIEGRMKSTSYISGVTAIYRRLLDERRNASDKEIYRLKNIFSRGGFTDGYFTGIIGNRMLGVRSERDKAATASVLSADKPFGASDTMKNGRGLSGRAPLEKHLPHTLADRLACRAAHNAAYTVPVPYSQTQAEKSSVRSESCQTQAEISSVRSESCRTQTESGSAQAGGISVRKKSIPEISILTSSILSDAVELDETQAVGSLSAPFPKQDRRRTSRFLFAAQIPESADGYFDVIALPPDEFVKCGGREKCSANAVVFPSVIHDSELNSVKKLLEAAHSLGAEYAYVGNLGHISLAREIGFALLGDFRLNVVNSAAPILYGRLGDFIEYILSPELILPQARDIRAVKSMIVYGRLPLMLLEKSCGADRLTDRRGVVFPVFREMNSDGIRTREIVYNSCPVWMADRQRELGEAGIKSYHFVFSDETRREAASVIKAYCDKKAPPPGRIIKRIQKK